MAAAATHILGIETSCDETAAAVVRRNADGSGEIVSNIVLSQIADHAPYGGVVPEIAARVHIKPSGPADRAGHGRGGDCLFRCLMAWRPRRGRGFWAVSSSASPPPRPLPWRTASRLLAINHLEGHALTPRLLEPCPFPYLLLLISGGHTQFQLVEGVGRYRRLGTTIDDALGEAFDKTAKLLGLGYPGGPLVEQYARKGNPQRFDFPRPLKGRKDCNFSFSGLKTAVREAVNDLGHLSEQDIADVCASFEMAVAETLQDRLKMAFVIFRETYPEAKEPALIVAGGVAANVTLKTCSDDFGHCVWFQAHRSASQPFAPTMRR